MRPFTKSKYNARKSGGYASKREAAYADLLRRSKDAGAILDWLEQVPIKLPGNVRYVVDFMIIELDGSVRFIEIKGMETPEWKIKIRILEEMRPELYKRLEVLK